MKILLANSPFGGGGITTYATQLIECLSRDAELTVVVSHDKRAPITNPNVTVIYRDTEDLSIQNALYFIDLINNQIRPDIVLVSAARILPVIIPFLSNSIKVITVSHSGKYYYSEYCAINNKYIDRIIAASSDYNKKFLERKYSIKNPRKIKVIYNFLDGDEELESIRFSKPNQRPIRIVYAGGASVHKSPDLVAKVVTELLKTDLDFVFYWMGKPIIPLTTTVFKRSKLKSVKQLMPEDKRLIFPGYIPSKRDFDKLIGSANIIIAPSNNEGCSMALLEGHRAGSIYIVADYGNSNREIVSKGNSGFVINHKRVDEFVSLISKIISHPEEYKHLYENSHATFKDYLTYSTWKESIMEVLNSPLNHKKRKKQVNRISLLIGAFKIRWIEIFGLIEGFFKQTLPSYISFRIQYNKYKRTKRRG